MVKLLPTFFQDEIKDTSLKSVTVHIGDRSIVLILGIIELGITKNQGKCEIFSADYSSAKLNIVDLIVTRVGREFYQILIDSNGKLHLYLPSIVDADETIWKTDV